MLSGVQMAKPESEELVWYGKCQQCRKLENNAKKKSNISFVIWCYIKHFKIILDIVSSNTVLRILL